MGDFLNRHSYLIVWITALILIGSAALIIFELNGYIPAISIPGITGAPAPASVAQPPAIPPAPSVSFVVEKIKTGNSFYVQWQHLPSGTTALNIYRGKTGTPESTWLLWKTITLSANDLANGSGKIDLGTANEDGYSFYVQAVNDGSGGTPLWTSSSTPPIVTTSTPGGGPGNPDSGNSNPPAPSSTQNPPPNNQPPNQNPSSTGQANNNPPTPTGTPYYNPQVQISAYGGEQTGNFWVQHIDRKIQIGWQNIPPETTDIVISRSQDQAGPWTTVLEQQNSGGASSYSLQIVDDTFGVSFYYRLNALVGTSTIATYGPIYLAGN